MLKKLKTKAKNWALSHREGFLAGKEIKELTMCKKCYAFYYKNSWHFDRPICLETDREEQIPVRFMKCAACLEQEISFFNEIETGLVLGRV